ncbi:hypothetical protein F5141DRAFT_1215564 [Pisolithus sp. B1]|nr:hypothetical protein F5141DRAFT_1215564 [Pisolithus sp. B1]
MDPQSARSPVLAGVYDPRYYALINALGLQPIQAKLDPDAVNHYIVFVDRTLTSMLIIGQDMSINHTYLMSLPGTPWGQLIFYVMTYSHHAAHRMNRNPIYAPTHPMNTNYLGSREEHSNRQIQHHPITHYATGGTTVAATGPAKAGNQTFQADPSSVSRKKVSNIGFI